MTQPTQTTRATITFHTTLENKERLERLAVATRRSRSFLSNEALLKYLEAEEDFIASVERGHADMQAGRIHDTKNARKNLHTKIKNSKHPPACD